MDRETRHELDRLFRSFSEALAGVRTAVDEDAELAAWRKVQMTAWELHEVLPAAAQARS